MVITIVLLIILAGVVINLALGENGLLNKTKEAKNETLKQAATEKINLKITSTQIDTYSKEQRMPTLQELADNFCEDDEIEYVELESKQLASLGKIEIGENTSFFTKLKEYPYEFEINSSLQLASIDGIKIASSDTVTISKEEYDKLKNANNYSTEEKIVGTWINGKPIYKKTVNIGNLPNSTYKDTKHNIDNVEYIVRLYGFTDANIPIQYVTTTGEYSIGAYANSTYIRIYAANDRSASIGYVTLEYTKTTDSAS